MEISIGNPPWKSLWKSPEIGTVARPGATEEVPAVDAPDASQVLEWRLGPKKKPFSAEVSIFFYPVVRRYPAIQG